jgi:hypothetical protein
VGDGAAGLVDTRVTRCSMRLVTVELPILEKPIPADVVALLAQARQRVDALEDRVSTPAFVPSDFELVYRALAAIHDNRLATGRRFIEWGSGIGAITCLGVLAGFDAVGIEIEPELVEIAEELSLEMGIAAQFSCGSFVPVGAEPHVDSVSDVTWLSTNGPDGYEPLELDPDDFDVVFAYPWPGEEQVIFDLFVHSSAVGALLLTYHGQDGLQLKRKQRR